MTNDCLTNKASVVVYGNSDDKSNGNIEVYGGYDEATD